MSKALATAVGGTPSVSRRSMISVNSSSVIDLHLMKGNSRIFSAVRSAVANRPSTPVVERHPTGAHAVSGVFPRPPGNARAAHLGPMPTLVTSHLHAPTRSALHRASLADLNDRGTCWASHALTSGHDSTFPRSP